MADALWDQLQHEAALKFEEGGGGFTCPVDVMSKVNVEVRVVDYLHPFDLSRIATNFFHRMGAKLYLDPRWERESTSREIPQQDGTSCGAVAVLAICHLTEIPDWTKLPQSETPSDTLKHFSKLRYRLTRDWNHRNLDFIVESPLPVFACAMLMCLFDTLAQQEFYQTNASDGQACTSATPCARCAFYRELTQDTTEANDDVEVLPTPETRSTT